MTTAPNQSIQLSNNTTHTFKFQLDQTMVLNNVKIIARKEDGYINVTELCKSSNKLYSNWKQNKTSEGIIKEFISVLGIPRTEIIKVKQMGFDMSFNIGKFISYPITLTTKMIDIFCT